jgi:hypothetical protein
MQELFLLSFLINQINELIFVIGLFAADIFRRVDRLLQLFSLIDDFMGLFFNIVTSEFFIFKDFLLALIHILMKVLILD